MISHDFASMNKIVLRFPEDLLQTNVGELSREVYQVFKCAADEAIAWKDMDLYLDKASMVDSKGVGLLVELIKEVQMRKGKIRLFISNQHIQKTLTFLKLDQQMEVILKKADGSNG
jgi:anti-anti-sigma factor